MKKLLALTAFAAGYVLGAKAGRDRYEQIRRLALRIKENPRVQETAHSAADKAREQAPIVGHKLADAAGAVAHKTAEKAKHAAHIGAHNGHSDVGDRLNPESTHFQEHPYPQGDLP
ncbi:MAG TPA: hypothetical protein VFE07_10065 [Marmoricola sp.]|nr:hypothetical protein [Marmoricola sp.]